MGISTRLLPQFSWWLHRLPLCSGRLPFFAPAASLARLGCMAALSDRSRELPYFQAISGSTCTASASWCWFRRSGLSALVFCFGKMINQLRNSHLRSSCSAPLFLSAQSSGFFTVFLRFSFSLEFFCAESPPFCCELREKPCVERTHHLPIASDRLFQRKGCV